MSGMTSWYEQRIAELKKQLAALREQLRQAVAINHAFKQSEENLEAQLAALHQERDEANEQVEWYGTLIKRAAIGTKATPSLRAYIEQVEAQLDALRLRWTSDTPKAPGWYWWRYDSNTPERYWSPTYWQPGQEQPDDGEWSDKPIPLPQGREA